MICIFNYITAIDDAYFKAFDMPLVNILLLKYAIEFISQACVCKRTLLVKRDTL